MLTPHVEDLGEKGTKSKVSRRKKKKMRVEIKQRIKRQQKRPMKVRADSLER